MARPKIEDESTRKIPITITLTREQIEKAKKKGRGNASKGIRKLLDSEK